MKQIILPIEIKEETLGDGNFIVSLSNLEAFNMVTKHVAWPENRLLLIGDHGSGKTHLCNIWASQNDALWYKNLSELYDSNATACIVENIDSFKQEDEIFHIINRCTQEGISLLMTASSMPSPELRDLRSRLFATYKTLIKDPDEELMLALIHRFFSKKQIHVAQNVIQYIMPRIQRKFSAIASLISAIDAASLSNGRQISIPLINQILEEEGS